MYDPMTYHMLADGIDETSGVASAPFIKIVELMLLLDLFLLFFYPHSFSLLASSATTLISVTTI